MQLARVINVAKDRHFTMFALQAIKAKNLRV
ncbi:hypothetical protein SRDD_01160 [Serratia sp. DD3]|nr:hypothetical protein SRDD_01160 [Serratia sp. DD3]